MAYGIKSMAKKRKVRQITLRNKRYSLRKVPYMGQLLGDCSAPQDPNRTIRLQAGLKGEEELEVTIHECLHGSFWDLSEESIEESAKDIAHILWRLGWRKPEV